MKLEGFVVGLAVSFVAGHSPAALVIDDFEGTASANVLGGSYFSYTDGFSSIVPAHGFVAVSGHDSNLAASFDYSLKAGVTYPYVGVGASLYATAASLDVQSYTGVRFWARGQGNFRFDIQTSDTVAAGNGFEAAINLSTSWKQVEIPFTTMAQSWAPAGTPGPRIWNAPSDASKVVGYNWTAAGSANTSGHIELDQLEFYSASEATPVPPANVVIATPKTNQVGYLPQSKKVVFVSGAAASAGQAFQIKSTTGEVVYEGTLSAAAIDDTAASGESVFLGNFSPLSTVGEFQAVVGSSVSHTFRIAPDVYRDLFRAAGRTFYLIRSGQAINDAETTIAHAASHVNDAPLRSDPSAPLNLVGGWYNAGDMGKYSHMTAIAVAYMMLAHELQPHVDEVVMGIPESGNGIPDVLNQARFGLEFLLEMQMTDGSVLHKVDSEPNLPYGILPETDTFARYAGPATSIDTGDFVGAMLQAARVFAKYDAAFANTCHEAALRAWNWLEANPNIASSDPYYTDADPSQERLFALSAMVADSKDLTLSERLVTALSTESVTEVAWMAPALLSLFDVARLPGIDATAAQAAQAKVATLADLLVSKGQASGYGLLLGTSEIAWESVETALHRANALFMAYELTANTAYHNAALSQVDWVLGANALDQSFVTAFGEHGVQRPYHWIFASMNKVMPGWAVGGPNQYATGADPFLIAVQARGTPPAKCYVDEGIGGGSWASNEGEVTDEAALLFASGMLFGEGLDRVNSANDAGTDGGAPQPADAGLDAFRAGGGACSCRTVTGSRNFAAGVVFLALALLARKNRR